MTTKNQHIATTQPDDAHEQTAAAMAADNCELWRQRAQRQPLTDSAAQAEREACAALVDKLARRLNGSAKQVARETATLIRARGQEGGAA